jgi:hypothetical protein
MSNVNQGTRAGNLFGRMPASGYSGNDWNDIVLKPGYIIKIRDRFALVEAVEGLSVDLYFNDSITVTGTGTSTTNTVNVDSTATVDESLKVARYGISTMGALLGVNTTASTAYRSTVLSPDYDSGYTVFKDLEPFKGHLYHLSVGLPVQPKFMTADGETLTTDGILPSTSTNNTGLPIGFPKPVLLGGDSAQALDLYEVGETLDTVATNDAAFSGVVKCDMVGTVSPKVYLKHPAGVPKYVLDESPEGSSGAITSGNILGVSGFIDGQISPVEDPDWSFSVWIEHGENNLPAFRMVNDSEEYLLDGRMRLQGWKYRIVELTMGQLRTIRERSGGRLTFKVINPAGLPTAGTMLSEYFPQ